jgi:hypothetical protein
LVKKGRHSKFAPKIVEGFLLGYDSNTKAYRVFNKSSGLVEVSSEQLTHKASLEEYIHAFEEARYANTLHNPALGEKKLWHSL